MPFSTPPKPCHAGARRHAAPPPRACINVVVPNISRPRCPSCATPIRAPPRLETPPPRTSAPVRGDTPAPPAHSHSLGKTMRQSTPPWPRGELALTPPPFPPSLPTYLAQHLLQPLFAAPHPQTPPTDLPHLRPCPPPRPTPLFTSSVSHRQIPRLRPRPLQIEPASSFARPP